MYLNDKMSRSKFISNPNRCQQTASQVGATTTNKPNIKQNSSCSLGWRRKGFQPLSVQIHNKDQTRPLWIGSESTSLLKHLVCWICLLWMICYRYECDQKLHCRPFPSKQTAGCLFTVYAQVSISAHSLLVLLLKACTKRPCSDTSASLPVIDTHHRPAQCDRAAV